MRMLLLAALAACTTVTQEAAGVGADVAEASYCEIADCGEVLLCTMPSGVQNEWCFASGDTTAAASASGAVKCVATPRGGAFGWPCLYSCPSPAHGCNAYQGCWCP